MSEAQQFMKVAPSCIFDHPFANAGNMERHLVDELGHVTGGNVGTSELGQLVVEEPAQPSFDADEDIR